MKVKRIQQVSAVYTPFRFEVQSPQKFKKFLDNTDILDLVCLIVAKIQLRDFQDKIY